MTAVKKISDITRGFVSANSCRSRRNARLL